MQKAAIQNVPPLMHVRDNLQQFVMSISHFGVIFGGLLHDNIVQPFLLSSFQLLQSKQCL